MSFNTKNQLGLASFALLCAGLAFGGCGDLRAPVNRVGTNVVEKSAFEGSWYMTEQIIDFDYEASALGFVGEISSDATSGGYAMTRIRWVIDQETLYAFRDYQTVGDAADPFSIPEDFLGQPIAAYRILSHFDIRRQYNTVTGEEANIIEENTVDRRWWERRFMRVDWSRNLLSGWYGTSTEATELFGGLGGVRREPTDAFIQSESNFPAEWRPHFYYMSCTGPDDTSPTCEANDRLWARDYDAEEFYSFDFVTQQLWSPNSPYCGDTPLYGQPECASVLVSIRTSFLRVSDHREYEALQWDDELFDRAGYFRLERDTFDAMTEAGDPSFGLTDYRNLGAMRHNIWTDWVQDDGVTPTPYAERDVRQVVWHTSRELPAHLVRPAYEVVGEWNVVLMSVVRERQATTPIPVYADQPCQTADPAGYCFCEMGPGADEMHDTADDVVLNPTCAGRYDPFEAPTDAAARIANGAPPFDCYVEGAAAAEPDLNNPELSESDFERWFTTRMVGTECAVLMVQNSCNYVAVRDNPEGAGTTNGLACQERGDIRFNLLSYVDQPGTPFLGVAQFRADPVTGELLGTDANIGGPALQSYRTRALQAYDLISGRLDDQEFFTGEDIRAYLEAAGRIDLPAPPRIDFSVASHSGWDVNPAISNEITNRLDAASERMHSNGLVGPGSRANVFDRLEALEGSDIERRLVSGTEALALGGVDVVDPDMSEAELLDRASPFRGSIEDAIDRSAEFQARIGALGLHMPNEYVDDSVLWYVNRAVGAGWTRARVEFDINRRLYRQTEIHEMGHCMGLRHDFAGSADTGNYAPDYYRIAEAMPLPDPNDFDTDGDAVLDYDESAAYEEEYLAVRHNRELSGIDAWMTSSIMDYTAAWYERIQGSGRHDWMAVALGYGELVDVYHRGPSSPASALEFNPANTPREYATFFLGGESCTVGDDASCPYGVGGSAAGELTPVNTAAGLTQTCVAHPTVMGRGVCTSFDEEAAVILDTLPTTAEYVPVSYRYCEDYRSATRSLPYCNTFDEGDSYREMVRNAFESYDRSYIFSAFRRYRRTFGFGGYIDALLRSLFPVVNIQQNLLYRWANDPTFRDEHGPWGFEDQFLATADGLNFMARILASPGIGSYVYDRDFDWYERDSSDPEAAGANLRVRLGAGRFFQSVYQSGLTGINRVERIGSFVDKIITMQIMTIRGLSPFYGTEVAFEGSLYDLFPVEMNQLFTGMIADQAAEYMPRVECDAASVFPACENPRVHYMDFYRGDCLTPGSTTCRPNPDITYDRPELHVLNGGDSFLLQSYAAIYGLAYFPIYFDTTFDSQMFLCIEGSGDCSNPAGTEGVDFARHTSIRYGQSYLAWQLDPSGRGDASIAFAMVSEAARLGLIVQSLKELRGDFGGLPFDEANIRDRAALDATGYELPLDALSNIDRVRVGQQILAYENRVNGLESFFNYLIQIEREYGIATPALWNRLEL